MPEGALMASTIGTLGTMATVWSDVRAYKRAALLEIQARVCVCACVRACARARAYACVCACACGRACSQARDHTNASV